MNGPWLVEQVETGEVHVVPIDDLHRHAEDNCLCGPTTKPVTRDDGSIGWRVTHHSLDGREHREGLRERLP